MPAVNSRKLNRDEILQPTRLLMNALQLLALIIPTVLIVPRMIVSGLFLQGEVCWTFCQKEEIWALLAQILIEDAS